MIIREISEKNFNGYKMIPEEFFEDIKNATCKGLACESDGSGDMTAAVLYSIKKSKEDQHISEAEIMWFHSSDKDSGSSVLKAFFESIGYEDTAKVSFELSTLSDNELYVLEDAGFSLKSGESLDVYVTVKELGGLSLSKKKIPEFVKPLSDTTSHEFKAGIMNAVFHGRYGLLDDLPFLPMTYFDQNLSCCVVTDDKINGLLLVHKNEREVFRVELLFAEMPDANINLLHMMCYSIAEALKELDPEQKVLLRRHNNASAKLVKKLFPDKKGAKVIRGEKKVSLGLLID